MSSDDNRDDRGSTTARTPCGTAAGRGRSLAGVCPETVVIQTDWKPEAEHGFLYNLVGDGYPIDTDKVSVTGPPRVGGVDTGVNLRSAPAARRSASAR